jgi:arylsulfatase
LLLGTGAVAAGAERPNILVIMGDDIGIWNISRYSIGQMGYQTPGIETAFAVLLDWVGGQSENRTIRNQAHPIGAFFSSGNSP